MIGVITSESGIPVLVTESDETHLGKTDDGKMNEGNGRKVFQGLGLYNSRWKHGMLG